MKADRERDEGRELYYRAHGKMNESNLHQRKP